MNKSTLWPFYLKLRLVLAFFLFLAVPVFPRGSQEKPRKSLTSLSAYYSGKVEEAVSALAKKNNPEERLPLVMLYWELGEMNKAADLLEELLANPSLKNDTKKELEFELFITRYFMGDYSKAASLRNSLELSMQGKSELERSEFYFYSAAVYQETGNSKRAEEFYKKSLEIHKWRPIGWYKLGLLLKDSDPKEAEKCLQTCWDQDKAFTGALLPLARLLAARKEWRKARDYLEIANDRFPNNREISAALAEARKNAPGGGSDGTYLVWREIKAAPPKVKPAPPFPKEGTIRIGLAERRTLISVKAGSAFFIHNAGTPSSLYNGSAGEQFWVEWNRGSLVIQDKNKKTIIRDSSPVVYELKSKEDSSIAAGIVFNSPGTTRTYRGALEFRPTAEGLTIVNILPMEDYLYSVTPSEMPYSWPQEALKVQAIAARSYSIANMGQYSERGFDLFGNANSMAYLGVSAENTRTTAAVDATRGMILMGGKEPLKAYFSANHGGYSEDCLPLWGYDAYMQAVPDMLLPVRTKPLEPDLLYKWLRENPATYSNVPRYSYISSYRWEKWVTPEEIRRRLPEDPGEIQRIVSRGRGISGRIVELEVYGSKKTVRVKGDAIWNAMGGLRSSLFTIRYKLSKGNVEYFIFQGAGHGHGIGMDQHGAAGMANAGISAAEILKHYYPRAQQERL